MSIKTKQSIVLITILIIEIIGFNNVIKYKIFDMINPEISVFFATNLIWMKISLIILLVTFVLSLLSKLQRRNEEPKFILYLIKGFQFRGGDLIGLFNVIFVLCSIAWIGSEFIEHTIQGYLNASIIMCILILFPLIISSYLLPEIQFKGTNIPKILIYAVSNMDGRFLELSINEMNEKFSNEWKNQVFYENGVLKKTQAGVPWGPWSNFDPIRKSIIAHNAEFNEIILIISPESMEKINVLKEEYKPVNLLKDFIKTNYPERDVVITVVNENVSGNEIKMNIVAIKNIINTLFARNYENKDILFNITGGTAAISSAMTVNAIPGERQAEYSRQDTGLIEPVDLNIYDVKELWQELVEKIG